MIKGDATINVTHDTIVAAMQDYLAKTFAAGAVPVVRRVSEDKKSYGDEPRTFTIEVGEATKAPVAIYKAVEQ